MVEEFQRFFKDQHSKPKNVLVLGLGGGALCSYLHQAFPQHIVEGVEIDPTMVELAKKYFGFNPNENLRSHVADGLSYVQNVVARGSQKSIRKSESFDNFLLMHFR